MTAVLPRQRATSVEIAFIDLMKLVFGYRDTEIMEYIADCRLTVYELSDPSQVKLLHSQCTDYLLRQRKVIRQAYHELYAHAPAGTIDEQTDWSLLEYELKNWLVIAKKSPTVIITPMCIDPSATLTSVA